MLSPALWGQHSPGLRKTWRHPWQGSRPRSQASRGLEGGPRPSQAFAFNMTRRRSKERSPQNARSMAGEESKAWDRCAGYPASYNCGSRDTKQSPKTSSEGPLSPTHAVPHSCHPQKRMRTLAPGVLSSSSDFSPSLIFFFSVQYRAGR